MLSCDEMEVRDAADVRSLYDDVCGAHHSPGAPATKDDVLLHLSKGADEIVSVSRDVSVYCAPVVRALERRKTKLKLHGRVSASPNLGDHAPNVRCRCTYCATQNGRVHLLYNSW